MNVFQELKERGFCYQATDEAAIEKMLSEEKVRFYVGFDPTGSSLHVGHLLPVMGMRILQKYGHIPIVLVGGATAQIGDPSGKQTARPMLTVDEVRHNAECLKQQLSRFIRVENGEAYFVNNNDWLGTIGYIEMLREVGTIFSVNRMLTQESVRQRLENGLSFLEFNYSILQAYDFMTLNRKYGCKLQFGGQDQWGNMVAGTELVRRKNNAEVHAMTIPLLLDSNGKKFGKTAGGNNVWLDVNRSSVFDYYQFWRNSEDGAVKKLLKYFSSIPVPEIEELVEKSGNINRAKEILAFEATMLAHGEKAAGEAYLAAGTRFGFADRENRIPTSSTIRNVAVESVAVDLPTYEVEGADLDAEGGLPLTRLLTAIGFCKSTSDARRLIQGNAVSLGEEKITDLRFALTRKSIPEDGILLKAGKKNFRKLTVR